MSGSREVFGLGCALLETVVWRKRRGGTAWRSGTRSSSVCQVPVVLLFVLGRFWRKSHISQAAFARSGRARVNISIVSISWAAVYTAATSRQHVYERFREVAETRHARFKSVSAHVWVELSFGSKCEDVVDSPEIAAIIPVLGACCATTVAASTPTARSKIWRTAAPMIRIPSANRENIE